MAEFKLVISDPKSGKSKQLEVKEDAANSFLNKKIGETIKGDSFDLAGYELKITGGSDNCGFPMRFDVDGTLRKKIYAVGGVGITDKKKLPNAKKKGIRHIKGMRRKKAVAGNTIHEKTAQINLKIVKVGSTPLFEAPKEESKTEASKPEETKAPEEEPVAKEPAPEN